MVAGNLRGWVKLNFSLVMVPLLILFAGLYYLASLQHNVNLREFEIEASEILESLRFYSETEKYLCGVVAGIFDSVTEPHEMKSAIEKFALEHRIDLKFFINNSDGSLYFNNVPDGQLGGDLTIAYRDMLKLKKGGFPSGEDGIPAEVQTNLRRVYGPHFFPRYFHRCFSGRNMTLRRGHASLTKPLFWMNFTDKAGLSVLFPTEVLDSYCGVFHYTHNVPGRLKTGYILRNQVQCSDPELAAEIIGCKEQLRSGLSTVTRLPGHFLLTNFIDADMLVFAAIEAEKVEKFDVSVLTGILSTAMFISFLSFAFFSYLVMVKGRSIAIRLKWQLLMLFLSSNILSGYVLYAAGSDYLQQYRAGLIADAYNDSMAYLQNIDELFVNELTVQKDRLEGSLVRLAKKLKKNGITRREVVRFVKEQRPSPYGVYLVASSTGLIANHHGSLKNEEVHESFVRGFANDRIRINTMRAMYKIGTYVLASLNKQKISTKAGTEAEMVCEALTQRSPADLIRMFADRGTFSEWGMGSKRHQTYVNMLQLFSERYFDYSLFYVWESDVLELEFIRRIFHNLNRNELGLRVSAVDEKIEQGFPQKSLSEPVLKQFALKLRDRSLTRPEFCRIDGIDYLLVGHKCVTLANIRLLGLYPMAKIEALVADKSNLLRILALVSLLVSVALSLFVAGSILRPLSELQAGVKALEERDFAWRVPDLGGDEFGHLAQIFNATLIDLEEMHAASQVQEKLLSRMEKPQNFGCFKFFCYPGNAKGNNVDYFDLLDGETGWRSIMFGRACARGVAGSLVLAFVKSAGLRLQHLVQSPGQFAATLNALLLKSSSNSVHAMELQNFLLLPEGKISYAGGGLSVMLLFDSNLRCVKVLKTDTIPLGELADRSFQTVDLQVSSGQALVVISMLPGNLESWLSALNVMKTVEPEEICRSFTEHCRVVGVDVPALLVISCV